MLSLTVSLCLKCKMYMFVPQYHAFHQSQASKSVGYILQPTFFEPVFSKLPKPQRCYSMVLNKNSQPSFSRSLTGGGQLTVVQDA